jgi:hypothetical protein
MALEGKRIRLCYGEHKEIRYGTIILHNVLDLYVVRFDDNGETIAYPYHYIKMMLVEELPDELFHL